MSDAKVSLQYIHINKAELVDTVNREADMDIPKMPSNQQLEGREIALVKNEFKINLRDVDKVLTLWRVDINVSISFVYSL